MTWNGFKEKHNDLVEAITIALAERRVRLSEKQYPPISQIWRAFDFVEAKNVKVVILGQDPYHGEGEANGLAFSVNKGITIPPSLKNIYKELKEDLGLEIPTHGDLTSWAKQGVMLLNTCLTVAKDSPGSHFDIGWEHYTDLVIEELSRHGDKIFMLWGAKAKAKRHLIDEDSNVVLTAAHPSPFSYRHGFRGCKHFSKANAILAESGLKTIDWKINE